jgi:hypothetical protein
VEVLRAFHGHPLVFIEAEELRSAIFETFVISPVRTDDPADTDVA